MPGLDPDLLPDAGVDLVPHPGVPPPPEPGVHRGPRGEVVREEPPRPAGPEVVEHGVQDLPGVGRRPAAPGGAGLRFREERADPFPLVVGQVGRVGLPCHARQW